MGRSHCMERIEVTICDCDIDTAADLLARRNEGSCHIWGLVVVPVWWTLVSWIVPHSECLQWWMPEGQSHL